MSHSDPSLDGPPWDEDAPDAPVEERDPNTEDMFGSPEPAGMREAEAAAAPVEAPPKTVTAASKPILEKEPASAEGDGAAYTVLARKYRPHTFEDLIGQEAMVRTLTNAFATGRIAHAFMLTGVRGVGKTTTARLLARALNNETDVIDRPSLELTAHGRHDASIMAGQHMDVVEMDAASHTGIDGIRDIIESVRYA
ncbi:MAG TPA: DNA polymerase III subunit gamma/tau, partial [Brevundimonas sp.]